MSSKPPLVKSIEYLIKQYLKMKFKNYLSKIVIVFGIISLLPVTSFAGNQTKISELKISIKLESAKLVTIFSKIKKEYDITFSYGQQITKDYKAYSVNYKETQLINVLNDLALKGDFTYKIIDNNVLIKKVEKTYVQQQSITGTITDVSGMGMPGATIVVKGTSRGVVSDIDGNYAIRAKEGQVLKIEFYTL